MKKDFDWTGYWQKCPFLMIKVGAWYVTRVFVKHLKGLEIKTCLEIGGGPGLIAKKVAQKFGYQLTLVENNREAFKLFKKYSNFGEYVLEDFFKYKPGKKFDLVFSLGVIEHFYDKRKRLEAIKVHKNLSQKYALVVVPKDSFLVRNFAHYPEDKGYEKLYKKEELKKELTATGLKPIKFVQNLHGIGFLCEI